MNKIKLLIATLFTAASLTACTEGIQQGAQKTEQNIASVQLDKFNTSQPIPIFDWSQLRQNLIDIETAQANTTATTSFMFSKSANGTTGSLIHWCPSIGFPIPATFNLSNPQQVVTGSYREQGLATIGQLESNGVYTGDTSGTYVICVNSKGKAYAFYHEGDVSTVTGAAEWDNTRGEIVFTGDPSANFSSGNPK